MLLPANILKVYKHGTELATMIQIHAKSNGTPVKKRDILLPRYSTKSDPMIAPNKRPSGNKEAIHDASLCVMGNGASSLVNNAK